MVHRPHRPHAHLSATSTAHAECLLERFAEHHWLVAWLLPDLLEEIRSGQDVSDLAPLLRGAGAEYAARVLEDL